MGAAQTSSKLLEAPVSCCRKVHPCAVALLSFSVSDAQFSKAVCFNPIRLVWRSTRLQRPSGDRWRCFFFGGFCDVSKGAVNRVLNIAFSIQRLPESLDCRKTQHFENALASSPGMTRHSNSKTVHNLEISSKIRR